MVDTVITLVLVVAVSLWCEHFNQLATQAYCEFLTCNIINDFLLSLSTMSKQLRTSQRVEEACLKRKESEQVISPQPGKKRGGRDQNKILKKWWRAQRKSAKNSDGIKKGISLKG
jgi:hypothetical protein